MISSTTTAPTFALYSKCKNSCVATAEDDHLLGSERYLHPRRRDAYLKEFAEGRDASARFGHVAVEDCLDYIAKHIHRFYRDVVAPGGMR